MESEVKTRCIKELSKISFSIVIALLMFMPALLLFNQDEIGIAFSLLIAMGVSIYILTSAEFQ